MTGKQRLRDNPYLLMAVLMVFWGSFAAVSKLVLHTMDSHQTLLYFFGIGWLALTIPLLWNGKLAILRRLDRRIWLKLALTGLAQFFYYFLYSLSLSLIPAMEASMLNYLFPLIIVVLAVPINGEKLNARKILSLLTGFAGALLIIVGNHMGDAELTSLPGDLLAVGAAFCWALFTNLGRKNSQDEYVSVYVYTTVGFLFSAINVLLCSRFALPAAAGLAGTGWMAVSNLLLTYLIWFRALRIAPASLVAAISLFTPVVTLLFIAILLGETLQPLHFAGAIILLVGVSFQHTVTYKFFYYIKTAVRKSVARSGKL